MSSLPADAKDYLPHRGKMLFLKTLDFFKENRAEASADITENLFLTADKDLDPAALIELAAQTSAAFNGYRNSVEKNTETSPRLGFLAGINEFEWYDSLQSNDRITIEITEETCVLPFSVISATIWTERGPAAGGKLKLYEQQKTGPLAAAVSLPEKEISGNKIFWNYNPQKATDFEREIINSGFNLQSGEQSLSLEFVFTRNFSAFDGHFPGFTLLPGVVLIKAAKTALDYYYGEKTTLRKVGKIKFGKPVFPDQTIRLNLAIPEKRDGKHPFTWESGRDKSVSGDLYL